jgi:hypothetical protein
LQGNCIGRLATATTRPDQREWAERRLAGFVPVSVPSNV